jgi:hypothetical protein
VRLEPVLRFGIFLAVTLTMSANALVPTFPYSRRTKAYNGWNAGARGDDTVIGMAGATVALPFNIGASELNPAGFAMLMGTVNAQVTGTEYTDRQIQNTDTPIKSNFYGLAVNPPPWGFAVTSFSPALENGAYVSPVTGKTVHAEVSVRELQFTAARMFFNNTFALGLSLDLAKANRQIGDSNENTVAPGFKIGTLYKLQEHVTLGLSYSAQNTIRGNPSSANQVDMPGFSQDIIMPTVIGAGIGWTPNRFFQLGASVLYVAGTSDTALLADEARGVGQYATLQPRVGGTYTFFQFEHFKGDMALGTYYEVSRVAGERNRLHETGSVDVNIYMFNTGIGIDHANGYRNYMAGIGIDIIRTLRAFDIVPKDNLPPYNGFGPDPLKVSADGLSEGLSYGEKKSVPNQSLGDVKQIIIEAPGKISDKIQGKPVEPSPKPSVKPKRKKRVRKTPQHTPEAAPEAGQAR